MIEIEKTESNKGKKKATCEMVFYYIWLLSSWKNCS